MNLLKALIQNCKIANATSNSTSVVLENMNPRSCLESRKLAKLKRRSPSSLDSVVLDAIMNTVYGAYFENMALTLGNMETISRILLKRSPKQNCINVRPEPPKVDVFLNKRT